MTVAKDFLPDDAMLVRLTEETLDEGKMVKLQLNELEAFEDSYSERYRIFLWSLKIILFFWNKGNISSLYIMKDMCFCVLIGDFVSANKFRIEKRCGDGRFI